MPTTIRQLLRKKGHHVWSIRPDAMVYDAIEQMADLGIGALLVMERNCVEGIITERDYARKCILQGRHSRQTRVAEIMTTELVWGTPGDTVEECMCRMTQHRVRHLPIRSSTSLEGVVSIGDLVKERLAEQAFLINQLTMYVAG